MKFEARDWDFVTGKAFSGKTYFIRAHIAAIPPNRHVYIYDMTHEYADLASSKSVDVWLVKTGLIQEFEQFIEIPYNEGNCTVVLSESDNYLNKDSPVIKQFVTTGRNRGIGAIVDCKRPKGVMPQYRVRFNDLVMFQTNLPESIEYLEDWCGTGRGSLDILRTLKQGEYIICDLDEQTLSGKMRLGGVKYKNPSAQRQHIRIESENAEIAKMKRERENRAR